MARKKSLMMMKKVRRSTKCPGAAMVCSAVVVVLVVVAAAAAAAAAAVILVVDHDDLVAMSQKIARTRTRDRTLDDRVDKIEQQLAKYMYQTMGLKAAFAFYNKDGNAGLDRHELAEILDKCNAEYHTEELDALMMRYDDDGNGTITLSEFTTTVPVSRPRLLEYLMLKDTQRAACLGLPVTCLLYTSPSPRDRG